MTIITFGSSVIKTLIISQCLQRGKAPLQLAARTKQIKSLEQPVRFNTWDEAFCVRMCSIS